jgi:MHS family alpha-ketoglutarate permease-like MFS transporter
MTQADTATATPPKTRSGRMNIVATSMGNWVEYLEWGIYSALTTVFASQIFPASDPTVSLLLSLATFALGFFARPVGAIVLGNLADTRGRKFVLTLSISLTASGALLIAIVPTYDSIGVLAPAIVLFARLAQGFGAGGEASSAATFLIESAPPGRRGFYGSWQQMSTGAGLLSASLLAALLTSVLSDDAMQDYGWRLGFGIAAAAGFIAMWVRRQLDETEGGKENMQLSAAERRALRREAFRTHKKQFIQILLLTVPGTIGNYMFLSYWAPFSSTTTGIDLQTALIANSCAIALYCVAIPFSGLLTDRIGRRPQLIIFCLIYMAIPYPVFTLLDDTFASVFITNLVGVLTLSLFSGTMAAVYNEQFPTSIRVAASGIPFALGVSIFGGTAPYVTTQLFAVGLHNLIWLYVTVAGLVGLLVVLTLPETYRKEITQ